MPVEIPDCNKFDGYKPCHPGENGETCIDPKPTGKRILIMNIGALGAVLMTTTILPAIKRKYPESTIWWLTSERASEILKNNPYIHKVLNYNFQSCLILEQVEFDIVFNPDKSADVCALVNKLDSKEKFGYSLNKNGVIVPINEYAEYNYKLGINNDLKFNTNNRTHPDMLREMMNLDRKIDEYEFEFMDEEKDFIRDYKKSLSVKPDVPVIGINTGSSPQFKNKRIPYKNIEEIILELFEINSKQKVVILGGFEDEERNIELSEKYPDQVLNTPTTEGIRRGFAYVDICDIVITADSLGMHMAIALRKNIIGWFNVTCSQEIEIFGRGEKLVSEVECSPCWKQECDKGLICHEENITNSIIESVKRILNSK